MVKVTHFGERIHDKDFSDGTTVREYLASCEIPLSKDTSVSLNSVPVGLDEVVPDNSVITVAGKNANG